jgi:hypothetical protein
MAVVVYTNPATGYRAWDVPGWCQWFDYYPSIWGVYFKNTCAPPTPEHIQETTLSNMGAAAASNPAVAAKVDAIASASPTDPFYCQADPQGCADYGAFVTSPTCSALLGTGSLPQSICNFNLASPAGSIPLLLIAGAGLVLLMLVRR